MGSELSRRILHLDRDCHSVSEKESLQVKELVQEGSSERARNINSLILTGPIIVACQWNTAKEKDLLQFGEAQVMNYFLPDKAAQKSPF